MSHTTPAAEAVAQAGPATPLSQPMHATVQVDRQSSVSAATKGRQDRFLEKYTELGRINHSAAATGIHVDTHGDWVRENVGGYRKRWEAAQQAWREALEKRALARIDDPQGNRGSDVLLLAMLNAAWPDKYRPGVIVADDTAKDLLAELRKRGRRVKPESSV
jgi:hypothetical protein